VAIAVLRDERMILQGAGSARKKSMMKDEQLAQECNVLCMDGVKLAT